MKIGVAFDNFAKFFEDEDDTSASVPAEVIRNDAGNVVEIRIYNAEYEQVITIDRRGTVEALSVEEYEQAVKFQ